MIYRRRSRHLLWVVLIAGLGLATAARAKTPADMEQAKKAFKQGQELYNKGDYKGALKQFSRGYKLSGKGGFLFNMAECARQIASKKLAREMYLRYVREHPRGKHRAEAIKQCRSLAVGPCPEDGSLTEPRSARPAVAPAKPLPPAKQLPPAEAEPTPAAVKADYLPPPAAPPGGKQERSRPFYKHWGFWAGVGAVVVAGSVTAVVLATRSDDGPSYPPADYTLDFTK